MKKQPRIYDIVVQSHRPDATLWRVVEHFESYEVGIIDAEIEDEHPNQRVQYIGIEGLMQPTREQMSRLT
jgi:hypothetical protein